MMRHFKITTIGKILPVLMIVPLLACQKKSDNEQQTRTSGLRVSTEANEKISKGQAIIKELIASHGGSLYDTASYRFTFREKEYSFSNNHDQYEYSLVREKNGDKIVDFLTDGEFKRYVNGKLKGLSRKEIDKYSNALNSVIYFATLPHKLRDKSVIKKYVGETSIGKESFNVVEVTFTQEGGGSDYQDVFYYWINSSTNKMDYLAYRYNVDGGGIRFRKAYNQRIIDGITFQDYINYKAPLGTLLADLPILYEQGELIEVSRIKTENVANNSTAK